MAFEVKCMRKWDFHSIHQASSCILSWFSGTPSETQALERCLMFLDDKVPSQSPRKFRVSSKDLLLDDGNQTKISPHDEFFDVRECANHGTVKCYKRQLSGKQHEQIMPQVQHDADIESKQYKDTLLKFYFNNKELPFTFKDIITADLRLLTLLESGLPSWVIFLQSYPLFCKLYRPWIRPLVRTLYILISLVTCIIGFYDLYKNVPLLKATASHVCGPLFNWIEDWDMISRVRYIGTMLFLQNFEKAMRWSLHVGRVLKLTLLLLTKPLMEPLQDLIEFTSPSWLLFCEIGSEVYSTISFVLMSIYCLAVDLFELLFSPFQIMYSYMITIVALLRPIFGSLWELFCVPLQIYSGTSNHVSSICSNIYNVFKGMLMVIVDKATELGHLTTHLSKAKPTTTEVSMWNSLWKDLLSKVFRSLKSIVYGLVAFLDTCSRHRLSTSNQLKGQIRRMSCIFSSELKGSQQALLAENCQKERVENCKHID